MTTKMNQQTVFVTFAGSSTLEFPSLETVPVYEPAQWGWVNLYYTNETIAKVDAWGQVTRLNVTTGRSERWFTRPGIAEVVTMGMRKGIGGYYYQFRADGSIHSVSPDNGAYYWGPVTPSSVEEVHMTMRDSEYFSPVGRHRLEALEDLHAAFLVKKRMDEEETRARIFPASESVGAWAEAERLSDERRELMDDEDRTPLTLVERYEATEVWRNSLQERLTMPAVRDSPAVRQMHEDMIQVATKDLARLAQAMEDAWHQDQACPECGREGVCMCYT